MLTSLAIPFAKHDGSNLRFEWSRKQGWFRFGSRRRLLEREHPTFGKSMAMFDLGYLGVQTWDKGFVDAVRTLTLEGMSFEGVVGKVGSGHKRNAIKLKSKAWVEKVIQ